MTKLKFLCAAALAAMSVGASAQFTNGGGSATTTTRTGSGLVKDCTPYDRIYVGYNPTTIKTDIDDADDFTLNGITFGYLHGFSLSKNQPLFLEVGARLNYSFKKEDIFEKENPDYEGTDSPDHGDVTTSYINLAVPVNLAYQFTTSNRKVSIIPFVGLTAKYNIKAGMKYDLTKEGKYYYPQYAKDDEVDYFDKKKVGKDAQWSRFQVGWQIGAGLDFSSFYVGLHYGGDFGEVCKKQKLSNWGISLGYSF